MTTVALVWSLFPTGTCDHGCDPPMLGVVGIEEDVKNERVVRKESWMRRRIRSVLQHLSLPGERARKRMYHRVQVPVHHTRSPSFCTRSTGTPRYSQLDSSLVFMALKSCTHKHIIKSWPCVCFESLMLTHTVSLVFWHVRQRVRLLVAWRRQGYADCGVPVSEVRFVRHDSNSPTRNQNASVTKSRGFGTFSGNSQ